MTSCKKDCMNCKHCILKKMQNTKAYTNTCEFENRIKSLTMDELVERIQNGTCDWFEQGEPSVLK